MSGWAHSEQSRKTTAWAPVMVPHIHAHSRPQFFPHALGAACRASGTPLNKGKLRCRYMGGRIHCAGRETEAWLCPRDLSVSHPSPGFLPGIQDRTLGWAVKHLSPLGCWTPSPNRLHCTKLSGGISSPSISPDLINESFISVREESAIFCLLN